MKIIFVTNVTLEPYFGMMLNELFSSKSLSFDVVTLSFMESFEMKKSFKEADIVVSLLNFEVLLPNWYIEASVAKGAKGIIQNVINLVEKLNKNIRDNFDGLTLWFGFEDYGLERSYVFGCVPAANGLVDLLNKYVKQKVHNDIFIDLKRMVAEVGIKNAYSNKGKFRWNAPYAKSLIDRMAAEVYKQYLIYMGESKKCVILDCDNVLWGGILSEDGIDGVKLSCDGLGREYQEFQRFILDLYYHGVILAICSKNDKADILQMFDKHSGMILRKEHFSIIKANWHDKAANIIDISKQLNIGLDSIIFVDDSKYEVGLVNALLPDVLTVCYNRNTIYEALNCLNLKENVDLEAVERRNETYRTNELRQNLRIQSGSVDEYLYSLQTEVVISETKPIEYDRVSELSQRTNKCTNGRRFTYSDVCRLVEDYTDLYTISVRDCFSDLGIVGVLGIRKGCIELFSLSCRALGRKVEEQMIDFSQSKGAKSIYFSSTGKNKSTLDAFKKRNFEILERSECINEGTSVSQTT